MFNIKILEGDNEEYELLYSNNFCVFEESFIISGFFKDGKIKFEFIDDTEIGKPQVKTSSATVDNVNFLIVSMVNFKNPLGTSTSQRINFFENQDLIYSLGIYVKNIGKMKIITLSFYKSSKSDVG